MHMQAIELAHVAQHATQPGIRWGSVFAGMCVGIAAYVLLMLLGLCAGMAGSSGGDASMAALAWNLGSAFIASIVGTFIAARSAGLQRAAEGALHGLVVWSCATVLVTLVALTMVRDVAGGMVLLMAQNAERETALAQIEPGRRLNNLRQTSMQPRFDDRPRYAHLVVAEDAVPAPMLRKPAFDVPAYAALMMCAAVAISLFGGIAGGLMGTRTPRRLEPHDPLDWDLGDMR